MYHIDQQTVGTDVKLHAPYFYRTGQFTKMWTGNYILLIFFPCHTLLPAYIWSTRTYFGVALLFDFHFMYSVHVYNAHGQPC